MKQKQNTTGYPIPHRAATNRFPILCYALCALLLLALPACEDMLDTGTNRYLLTEDNDLSSSGDTLSSVVGIYRNMQKLADRYVILGELRGELMDVTENATLDLRAIHNFDYNLTENNPYLSVKEYYAVINNCNYFIDRVDAAQNKALMREYAAVKAMRAWTYMQLVLNYGEVYYYEKPLLTIDDMEKIREQEKCDFNTLARNKLIPDLMSCEAIQLAQGFPAYSISSVNFIPITLLLADLYLWTEQYELAATKYHEYIERERIRAASVVLIWGNINFDYVFRDTYGADVVSQIALSQNGSIVSDLPHLFLYQSTDATYYELKPSTTAMNNWSEQDYLYAGANGDSITHTQGDLRGTWPSNQISDSDNRFLSYRFATSSQSDSLPYVSKYGYTYSNEYLNVETVYVHLHKSGSIYLRYAEALNHLNKPTMAFAVLKNGLYESAIRNPKIVSPDEVSIAVTVTGPSLSDPDQDSTYTQISIPPYCNFPDNIFGVSEGSTRFPNRSNVGIHERGCGEVSLDTLYCIPDASVLPTRQDTIRYVDELICNEYALETAFEGNRFHDLMRFAIRWNDNDFLAERVARKHNNDPAIRAKLNNRQSWYLPLK
jgi:hypothetical protein